MDELDVERFRSFVDTRGTDECWWWTGDLTKDGYGQFSAQRTTGRKLRAHRAQYELLNGRIPPGIQVRHTCDNRSCVSPNHLILGTNLDNVRDKIERGRQPSWFGESNPHCKISDFQRDDILRRYDSGERVVSIHRDYTWVTFQAVWTIAKRRSRTNGSQRVEPRFLWKKRPPDAVCQ